MLSQSLTQALQTAAVQDCDDQISNAALWYKRVDHLHGFEMAKEASLFYCRVQRNWMESHASESDAATDL